MNNSTNGKPEEESSNELNQQDQGVRPKVKSNKCVNEAPQLCTESLNGACSNELSNIQNGASCSSSLSLSLSSPSLASSSSSFFLSQVPVDKQNGEYCAEKCSAKGRTLSAEENDGHDKKRRTSCFVDSEASSGNDGEEGFSGDDCCIYTYKGDQFADLPNSFLSVDMVTCRGGESLRENHRKANHSRGADDQDRNNLGSSPEMDYLEMDFDPGPSLEQDSEEDMNGLERKASYSSLLEFPNEMLSNDKSEEEIYKPEGLETSEGGEEFQAGPSGESLFQCPQKNQMEVSDCNSNSYNRTKGFLGSCCESFCNVDENNTYCNIINKDSTEENLESTVNKVISRTCSISMSERLDKKMLSVESNDSSASQSNNSDVVDGKSAFDGIMLWSEQEAISKQMTFASSDISCAATAIINAMLVLKMRISIEEVKQGISARLKSKSASIPEYLVSRSYAGFVHSNLIRGIRHASHGLLFARFFQMYPRRDIILTKWLSHWMKKGAVPIVTMNVQRSPSSEDPTVDIRHHQMIFGVNGKGIYLTNPLECLQEEELWTRFVSPSVLKIKRSDIVSRWSPDCNLKPLMCQSDERWKEMNVLGQVVNIIREFSDSGEKGKFLTQHVFIPASSGITLVIHRHSTSYHELISTEDLPLYSNSASQQNRRAR